MFFSVLDFVVFYVYLKASQNRIGFSSHCHVLQHSGLLGMHEFYSHCMDPDIKNYILNNTSATTPWFHNDDHSFRNEQPGIECPVCSKHFFLGGHHFATEKLWSHMGNVNNAKQAHKFHRSKIVWHMDTWKADTKNYVQKYESRLHRRKTWHFFSKQLIAQAYKSTSSNAVTCVMQ